MSMTIAGKIIHILEPEVVGTNQKRKQTFVLQMDDRYETKVAFDVWEDKVAIGDGETATFHLAPESREAKGRWFTNLTCWKKEGGMVSQSAPVAQQPATNTGTSATSAPKAKITPNEEQFKVLMQKVAVEPAETTSALVAKFKAAYELTTAQAELLEGDDLPF